MTVGLSESGATVTFRLREDASGSGAAAQPHEYPSWGTAQRGSPYPAWAFVSGNRQIRDIAQLTNNPITQPSSTSPTLCSPCSTPLSLEWWLRPAAMTMAAVIGAWRHIVWMWTTYDEMRTVTASASGRLNSLAPSTRRKNRPTAQPISTLMMRLRNMRAASFTWGSDAATIEAIAQMGFVSAM